MRWTTLALIYLLSYLFLAGIGRHLSIDVFLSHLRIGFLLNPVFLLKALGNTEEINETSQQTIGMFMIGLSVIVLQVLARSIKSPTRRRREQSLN